MHTFVTSDGQEWQIAVSVATIKRVMDATGLKLTDLFSTTEKIQAFFSDEVKICEVLYAAVQPQAGAHGKSIEQFLSVIDGTVLEAAVEALLAEVVDFFHEPRKGLLKKVLEKYRQTTDKLKTEGALVVEKRLEEVDFERLFLQTLTSSASSSPAPVA